MAYNVVSIYSIASGNTFHLYVKIAMNKIKI